MSSADPREPDALERETLLAYEAPSAPADLADRVLAALRTETELPARPRTGRTRRLWIAAASVAVSIIAAAVLLRSGPGGATSSAGHRVVTARESIAIGGRAVAVAEAGSELSWTVLAGGAATVDQRRGDVFYRVTPGQPFAVLLPGAAVRVLGTSFRVEVSDMRTRNKLLAAGATGVALSAAVLVTVYEGRVRLENEQGEVELAPGEQGTAADGAPPATVTMTARAERGDADSTREALQGRVRDLERKLRAAEDRLAAVQSPSGGAPPDFVGQFDAEQRDSSWAPGQEQRIQERLTRFLGLERGSATVECRRTCCQIGLDAEELGRVGDDLSSDVGLKHLEGNGGGSMSFAGREDGVARVILCLQPEDLQPGATRADRGEEREALLAASRPAVDACMRGAATPLDFETMLAVDPGGEIYDVTSRSDPVGHPAAACVEQALLGAARFAPSTRATRVPVRLHLVPLR